LSQPNSRPNNSASIVAHNANSGLNRASDVLTVSSTTLCSSSEKLMNGDLNRPVRGEENVE